MSVRRLGALALVLLVCAPAWAAPPRATWRVEDAEAVAHALLADPELRAAADARAPLALRVALLDGPDVDLVYDAGELRRERAPRPYVLALSVDAALVVLGSDEPRRALRCLHADGALAVVAPSAAERAALRGQRALARSDCAPPAGATETAPGLFLLDGVAYDRYGARLGWQDAEAPAALGRADAGLSRLAPHELPRAAAPPDLADPWRAPLVLRAVAEAALDCPCAPPDALIPPGDWRAALAADPRAQGGVA